MTSRENNSHYECVEWDDYLDLLEKRHGKEARELAEKWGTAEAGEHGELLRRQRISRNVRRVRRRR